MSINKESLIEANGKALKIDIQKAKSSKHDRTKPKRKDKSDLGENFIPPDGGWGWAVAVGSGLGTVSYLYYIYNLIFSNLTLPILALHICYDATIWNYIPRKTV